VGHLVVSGALLYWFIIILAWKGSAQVRGESTTDPGLRKGQQQAVHFSTGISEKRSFAIVKCNCAYRKRMV